MSWCLRGQSALALLLVVYLAGNVYAEPNHAKPQRIVSLSLCTDQILLMLADSKTIAAVSNFAADSSYSYMWKEAQNIPFHSGLAEQIIPLQPDLIIGPEFNIGQAAAMLEALGLHVLRFNTPTTLKEVSAYVQKIGQAIGEPERAQALIAQLEQELIVADNLVAQTPKQLAVSYAPNGFTAGNKTLKGEILNRAGYHNLADQLGIEDYGNISVEQLLYAQPDLVIIDDGTENKNSLAQSFTQHPALRGYLATKNTLSIPHNYWLCPGPTSIYALTLLAQGRQ
ncbi:MAG: ABC transporter substrate-binding protein [Halioglobus sp.]|nr:ABC transporter substrate-binding protein [Halioglobus sp.]